MNITLCSEDGTYASGSQLQCSWRISRMTLDQVSGVEVTVLWSTDGKGDEDIGVIHFQRYDAENLNAPTPDDRRMIQCRLPAAPLSYRGHLVQIDWCVRIRVFAKDGREIVTEQPFYVIACESIVEPSNEPSDDTAPPNAVKDVSLDFNSKGRRFRAALPNAWSRLRGRHSN
ncbi:MAG: hypothetical protein AAF670_21360 [Planctomycetota bacterium]